MHISIGQFSLGPLNCQKEYVETPILFPPSRVGPLIIFSCFSIPNANGKPATHKAVDYKNLRRFVPIFNCLSKVFYHLLMISVTTTKKESGIKFIIMKLNYFKKLYSKLYLIKF